MDSPDSPVSSARVQRAVILTVPEYEVLQQLQRRLGQSFSSVARQALRDLAGKHNIPWPEKRR